MIQSRRKETEQGSYGDTPKQIIVTHHIEDLGWHSIEIFGVAHHRKYMVAQYRNIWGGMEKYGVAHHREI